MQALCKISNSVSDIRCPLCGQGFLLYWERTSRVEQDQTRRDIQQALRAQHSETSSADAHPQEAFNVPSWSGQAHYSGAALLGGLPDNS